MAKVYINRTAAFLPNIPIDNDQMEAILGKVVDMPSRSKALVLRNNGIKTRYYALDDNGKSTHTNADLTKEAVSKLLDKDFKLEDIELLSCGTTSPDMILPSHAAMVHGLLKSGSHEINSASGSCCAGMNAFKYAYMSVASGLTTNAICTGSERTSTWMKANKFDNEVENMKGMEDKPILAFKKDFLRWMLSDGAGAMLMQNKPTGDLSLEICWTENFSFANELEVCMYVGGDKLENGTAKSWSDYEPNVWISESIFAMKQDVKILDQHIIQKGVESMAEAMKRHDVKPEQIDYFLPHISSMYFKDRLREGMAQAGIEIEEDKWFLNLPRVGNVGAGSIYLMLDELFHSGNLKKGELILLSVPESARFSYAYALLKVI